MKKCIFLSWLFISINCDVFSQLNYSWAKPLYGQGIDNISGITEGTSGNIYVIGNFSGTMDFDPSSGTAFLIPYGSTDVFIAKYDANGNYIWAKDVGGALGSGSGADIVLDASENVYITGYIQGTVDFDPSAATSTMNAIGNTDLFVAKYDVNGNYLWAKSKGINGGGNSLGKGIALDNSLNVIICGTLDPNSYFSKYTNSGTFLWGKTLTSPNSGNLNDVYVNNSGNIFVTGNFTGTIDLDPGAATAVFNAGSQTDILIGTYDNNGIYVWGAKGGTGYNGSGNAIIAENNGNVYITGKGENKVHISKWNSTGSLLWLNKIGCTSGCLEQGYNLSLSCSNSLLVSGFFLASTSDPVNFDGQGGTYTLTPSNGIYGADAFVSSYNPSSGTINWARNFGGGIFVGAKTCMFIDNNSNIYLAGSFDNPSDFDPSAATVSYSPVATSIPDSFFAKYSGCSGVGINEVSQSTQVMNFYPNPNNGNFIIDLNTIENQTIQIFDVTGKKVLSQIVSGKIKIDASGLNDGVYYVSTSCKEGVANKRLVIVK